jgi:hypothetical protein
LAAEPLAEETSPSGSARARPPRWPPPIRC